MMVAECRGPTPPVSPATAVRLAFGNPSYGPRVVASSMRSTENALICGSDRPPSTRRSNPQQRELGRSPNPAVTANRGRQDHLDFDRSRRTQTRGGVGRERKLQDPAQAFSRTDPRKNRRQPGASTYAKKRGSADQPTPNRGPIASVGFVLASEVERDGKDAGPTTKCSPGS